MAAPDSDTLEKPALRHPEVLRRRARHAARGAARDRTRDRARDDRRPGSRRRRHARRSRRLQDARRPGRRASRGRRHRCRSTASCPPICPSDITRLAGRRGAPRRLIVAPAACHLPADFATWGWAIQLYAARSRRSWGIGDLADLRWLGRWAGDAGRRHRAHQSAGRAGADAAAAAEPLLPFEPPFPQPALSADRGSRRRARRPRHLSAIAAQRPAPQ